MDKKEAINILYENMESKVVDLYDSHQEVATALNTLIDGFEYPDYSYKTIKAVLLSYFIKNNQEFDLGRTLCHHSLNAHIQDNNIDIMPIFYNHSHCNWGRLTDDDQLANYVAIATQDGRLLSKYKLDDGKDIYLMTDFECGDEQPRLTTAMFIQDY